MSILDTFRTAIFGPEQDKEFSPKQKTMLNENLEQKGIAAVDNAYKETKDVNTIPQEIKAQEEIAKFQEIQKNADLAVAKDTNPLLAAAAEIGAALKGADWGRAEAGNTGQLHSTQVASADKVDQKFKDKLAGLDEGIA
jgi:hypothetical protein